ncbi:MAG: NACHT domain-containing protein [Aliarcobacter skirrowii]|nr:NACHT domain-containing protein [Aliarcobacter skirrowii]MDD2509483.1 NACHT domain-containing protein [Aliarcobacter skirrowii]
MDRELLKKEIITEIGNVYKNNNINETVDLMLSVMLVKTDNKELAGVAERQYNAFCKVFDEEVTINEIKLCLSDIMKIEPMLKKILLLVDKNEYEKVQAEHLGLAHVIKKLGLNPDNKKLDQNPECYANDLKCMEHISRSYNLRNSESHTYECWNRREIYVNLDSVIITCLNAITINKAKLIDTLKDETLNSELSIDAYLNELIDQFKTRMKRFIHIRGEENFSVLGSYVIENQDDSAETKRRKGTVECLRDTEVPERRMMIWGEAGMGKSTTLEYLSYVDAKKRQKDMLANIPVLIILGVMTKSSYTIKQFICDKLQVSMDTCEILLKEGKINLFIDGLNEIPNDSGSNLKTLRLREIRQLINSYPKTFFIITNRPQESRDFGGVPIFNLIKLSKDEIKDFIDKNVDEKSVKELLYKSTNNNERFIQIINTPLILSRLIEIVKYKKEIPQSEGEIISEFLDCLFKREKEEKQDARLDIKKITYLLRMVAFESLEKKNANSGISEAELLSYCAKSMDTYRFSYDALYAVDMVAQLGIMEKKEDLYVFSHQAYQDHYYALEELAVLSV